MERSKSLKKRLASRVGAPVSCIDYRIVPMESSNPDVGELQIRGKSLHSGVVKYITTLGGTCSFNIENKNKVWTAKAEMVDAVKVTGKVVAPYAGFSVGGLSGEIRNTEGKSVATFTTAPNGEFEANIEGGRNYVAVIFAPGYASSEVAFTATNGAKIADITLDELQMGASGTAKTRLH